MIFQKIKKVLKDAKHSWKVIVSKTHHLVVERFHYLYDLYAINISKALVNFASNTLIDNKCFLKFAQCLPMIT